MEGASPAHDINHVMRVYNLCLRLARHEPHVDLDILRTAALLHDSLSCATYYLTVSATAFLRSSLVF
jgi:HD superfamily phosphodiesterase